MRIDFPTTPKRILIIKPSALGDIVHALPVLNLLRARFPEAHIAWLVGGAFASLLEGHPQLDQVIRFERRRAMAAAGMLGFAGALRRGNFELVIDLQGLLRSGWMTFRTRAPVRVGFSNARELAPLFYTHRVPIESPEQHAIERYLTLCEALGCGRAPVEFRFHLTDDDRQHVARLVGHDDRRIGVLLPGTNWPTKRWPVEHFAALVEPLRRQFGLEAVIAGGPDVAEIASQVPGAMNLVGRTNLRELVALLERADLVIANDSGPMHIAAALGRPLVTMFGPTNPIRTGPYERLDSVVRVAIPCSPCYSRKCSHVSCMRWLGVEDVLRVAAEQMYSSPLSRYSGRGSG